MKVFIPVLFLFIFSLISCNENNNVQYEEQLKVLQMEVDSLQTAIQEVQAPDQGQITSFLTFQENNAEEAMNFYVSIFDNSKITEINRYEAGGPAPEGSILMARFELNGSLFACSDSYVKHEWDFTPGVSQFVDCTSEEEIKRLLGKLSENGNILMPLNNYGFSTLFAFVEDQYGVSWQLNLD